MAAAVDSRPAGADPKSTRGGARLTRFVTRAPQLSALVARVLGLLTLVGAFWPHHLGLSAFNTPLPHHLRVVAHALDAAAALMLLRVAAGLGRRKRAEWLVAVAASIALLAIDLVAEERRPIQAALALALLVVLVIGHSAFTAHADRRSRRFAVGVGVQFAVVGVAYGMVSLYLNSRVASSVGFGARLRETLLALIGLGGTIHIRYSAGFHATMVAFGALAVLSTLALLMRPDESVGALTGEDEVRLRALLDRHGARDSLGYFALRADKSVVWSSSGKAAITYRVVDGVALISGDPIGDPEAWPGAIDGYRALLADYGWTPAVMGCSELGATIFKRELGLSALVLGDEAVLRPERFCLDGRAMRGIRQACAKLDRAGYEVTVHRVGELSIEQRAELRGAAELWRVDPVERGFSMALSRIGHVGDDACVVVTARLEGRLCGLLHFVPWSTGGLSLDLMRRDRGSDNGLNELMITKLMAACPQLGVTQVSLNFAVFRDALERGAAIGAGPVLRLWRRILLIASRWWQIDSLYRFNGKFQPDWVPRFICFPCARAIPRIALAAMEAERFIVRPAALNVLLGRG